LAEANRVIEEDKKVRLGTLKELQAARKECEDYAEDLKRVAEERDELARKGGNGDKIAKDLADLQKKFQDFMKKKEAAEEQVNSLQAYIDKQNEKLSKAEESIKSKDAELVKLREKSVKLSNDLLLISNSTESTTTGLQEKIQQLQNKLDATEKEKKELAQNFEKLNAQHTELSTKFDRLNKELQAARDVLTTQKKTIAAKEKEISALQQTLAQSSSSGTAPTVVTTIVPDEEVVKERDSLLETVKKQKERIQQLTEANETTQEVISQLRAQEKSRQMYQPAPITIETSPIVRSDNETEVDAQVRHLNEKIQQLYLENANRKLQAWELEQDKYNIVRELQETRKKVIDINNERKNDDQRVAQRFEEQIRVLNANLESAKATNDKLTSELEKQNRELRELSIKMRSVKEFNEELKGEVTHLRQKLSSTERQRSKSELPTPKTPTRPSMRNGKTEDESSGGEDSILLSTSSSKSRRNEKGVIVNPATSHALYRKQQILLDPLGSVKRSVLAIIEYFDMRVEQENTTIDTIGYGRDNPALVHIIHTQLCAALVAVFQHGFSGPFWLLTTAHYWHMIEEIVDSYQNVQESGADEDRPAEEVFALQLRKAVRNVNNIINREIQYELKTGRTYSTTTPIVVPQNEHELKFRALVVSLLNDKLLNVLFKFLMHDKHRAFWKRFYDQNALLRQLECQNKLITYLSLLMKLPFDIEVETTCKASSYVKEELTSAFELE
jgi:peptidoglycan hydrolase CwlO-like protein